MEENERVLEAYPRFVENLIVPIFKHNYIFTRHVARYLKAQALGALLGIIIQEIYFWASRSLIHETELEPVYYAVLLGVATLVLGSLIMLVNPEIKSQYNIPRNVMFVKDERPVIDIELRICRICNLAVDERTHHCKYCNKCIEGFDHHCVYLSYCIGKRNYRLFVTLLALIEAHLAFFICYEIQDLIHYVNHTPELSAYQVASAVGFALCIVILIITFGYVSYLIFFHLRLAYYKQTTLTYSRAQRLEE